MRALVIDDEKQIRDFVSGMLIAENFSVDMAEDGEMGSYLARTNDYDIVILDNILPGKLGADVCRDIRAARKTMPILMLTVVSEVSRKIEGLNMGADDYMTKPFALDELLARVRALTRRPRAVVEETLIVDDLVLNTRNYSIARGKRKIYLTRKEFELLEYLMRNQGRVLSRAMIMEHVWDLNADPFSNTIETHILNLRRKLEGAGRTKLIHTVPGRGYKIDA